MNLKKLLTLAIIFAISTAASADDQTRQKAVLDQGPGGLLLVASAPGFTTQTKYVGGPKDGQSNDSKMLNARDVIFSGQTNENRILTLEAGTMKLPYLPKQFSAGEMANALAQSGIKAKGFNSSNIASFDCPKASVERAIVSGLKVSGIPTLYGKAQMDRKESIIVCAIFLPDQLLAYIFSVEMRGTPDDFDANQMTIDTAAIDNITDFISHTTVHLN